MQIASRSEPFLLINSKHSAYHHYVQCTKLGIMHLIFESNEAPADQLSIKNGWDKIAYH